MNVATHNRVATRQAREVTLAMLQSHDRASRRRGQLFQALLLATIVVAIAMLMAVLTWALVKGWPRLDLNLIRNMPSGRRTMLGESGLQSAITGTLYVMAGLVVTVVPLGVSAAVYLEEFADHSKRYVRFIELNVQNLAAVPSIVFGILGMAFIYRGGLTLG